MKYLAQGQPDFSKRLVQHSPDELGVLTGWFNLLSEKLEQDYKKIELLSITDKLTSLYNRTKIDQLFTDELKRAERYGEGFSVILIDLDYFKSVNDTYGHQVGDTVLQEMSRLLRESVRKTDYVGRWGGEEFLVISPQSDIRHALHLAEKLRKMINEYNFSSVGRKTASFGVVSHRAGDCADSMMQRADECLYIAKEQGRNRVVGET
jgi:diguanylate cyclase (GGDEF)-like protein